MPLIKNKSVDPVIRRYESLKEVLILYRSQELLIQEVTNMLLDDARRYDQHITEDELYKSLGIFKHDPRK